MNSLYDVYLGDIGSIQGYRCRSTQRDSAPLIASRFSSGSQGQTDLDLLKSASIDSLAGGMFQRDWEDSEKVARAVGVFNPYDKNTYPTTPPTNMSWTGISQVYQPQVKAESENYSFMAITTFSAGTYYNQLLMVTKNNPNWTKLTLPAGLASSNGAAISSIALHKGALFIASQNVAGFNDMYRYDIDANTFTLLPSNGGTQMFCTLRGTLYALNRLSEIYSVQNEMSGSPGYTFLTAIGFKDYSALPNSAVEFNGAMWISKYDGIYRFDGVSSVKVLGLVTAQLQVFNGAMYFVAGRWLYKFDGANVVRLQFFGNEIFGTTNVGSMSLSANSDYLFIQTSVLTSAFQGDKVSTASALTRIYTYDGAAFMLFKEESLTLSTYMQGLLYCANKIYDILAQFAFTSWDIQANRYDLAGLFTTSAVTTGSKLEFTSSEFDDGFPNIYKSLELIEAAYSGLISGDSLVVSYQYYDGKVWSSWITAGTITSTTGNTIEITDSSKKLFRRLKINLTLSLAAGSSASLKGASIRYTLQPRARWRWQTMLMCQGNGITMDRNNNPIATDSNALSNSVIRAIKQKTPIFMFSPDYGVVKTGVSNSATSFVIPGQIPIYTDPYSEYALCSVKNNAGVWEVLRVTNVVYNSGTDETTVTVAERGYYGVTPGAINAGAEFHIAYKVYVTRLLRDAPVLDENTYNEQTSGESQLQREFLLEITEV